MMQREKRLIGGKALGLRLSGGQLSIAWPKPGMQRHFRCLRAIFPYQKGGFTPMTLALAGLKTAVLRLSQKLQQEGIDPLPVADIAASFQARWRDR